ncbi:hypothetical protein [Marinoscillum pacificum]|uniref:hypothetical protein n=1 Tax=Marinoscillum pacificum TaxID=392723 RepID=UPI0021585695|nr:hypothetical protein [Marinoscillum pacificum]
MDARKFPKWRSHVLRGLFFLNFISLFFDNWSQVLGGDLAEAIYPAVTVSFWAAFSLLNVFGVINPLRFIPILLLQLVYKSAWLVGSYWPAFALGSITEDQQEFFWICVAGIVLNLLIIPWRYTFNIYIKYQQTK